MQIPITFDYKGKEYKGIFTPVHGVGANVWHLMIDNYYYGRLVLNRDGSFSFHGNTMEELSELFGNHITVAYESL